RVYRLRTQLRDGIDPLHVKSQARTERAKAKVKATTFRKCSDAYIAAHEAEWRNDRSLEQWQHSLTAYAHPVIGDLPVAEIDTALVLEVLEPIWLTKTETAKRLRGRIESVLSYAKTSGLRTGDNPAQWRGHLDQLLAKPGKVIKVEHMPAAE